jgi:hypothetical protein
LGHARPAQWRKSPPLSTSLERGTPTGLEIHPNLWAGIGLVRGGAGTALVGSHEEVAERIKEIADDAEVRRLQFAYATTPGTFADFVVLVVPELRTRGRIPARPAAPRSANASTARPAAPDQGRPPGPAIANSSSGGVNQPERSSFPSFPIGLLGKCDGGRRGE